jgi:hypothetical protein
MICRDDFLKAVMVIFPRARTFFNAIKKMYNLNAELWVIGDGQTSSVATFPENRSLCKRVIDNILLFYFSHFQVFYHKRTAFWYNCCEYEA